MNGPVKLDLRSTRLRASVRADGARFWREEDLLDALNQARKQNRHQPIAVAAFDVFRDILIDAGIQASRKDGP